MNREILILAISLVLAGCSSSDNDRVVTGPVALEDVGQDLLVSLAGFQADNLSLSVRELAVEIAADGEAMPLPDSTFETLNGFGPELVVSPTQNTAYTCSAGGQMIHETGRLRDGVGTGRSLRGNHDAYTFDACRHSNTGEADDAGVYQLDGELVMDAANYNVDTGARSSHSNSWARFAMTTPAGLGYELSGSVAASAYSAANFGTGDTRTVDLQTYQKTSGTQTMESLENASLFLTRTIPNGSNDSSYQLDADGITVTPATMGVAVTINTDPPLSSRRADSQNIAEPFSGQITMVAADGGELILSAIPSLQGNSAPGDLLVDLVTMRPDGETITTGAAPLIDIFSIDTDNGCYISDTSGDDCATVELP